MSNTGSDNETHASDLSGMSLEDKIRALDEPIDDDPTPLAPPSSSSSSLDNDDSDVIVAMQELLLKHESTSLHKVEDPDLERVLRELRTLAHSNIADVFQCETVSEYIGLDANENEVWQKSQRLTVKDITTLPREISACIQSVKVTSTAKGDVVEVKLYDKQVSLDKLMRFHGAYVKDNEQINAGNEGVMDLLLVSIGSTGLPVMENNNA